MNESATCREYVRPRLEAAGWDDDKHPIIEQKSFTDGRIIPISRDKTKRRKQKRADYLLHYTRDYTIAVVEAKAEYKLPGDGLQQAKDYAEILGSGLILPSGCHCHPARCLVACRNVHAHCICDDVHGVLHSAHHGCDLACSLVSEKHNQVKCRYGRWKSPLAQHCGFNLPSLLPRSIESSYNQ